MRCELVWPEGVAPCLRLRRPAVLALTGIGVVCGFSFVAVQATGESSTPPAGTSSSGSPGRSAQSSTSPPSSGTLSASFSISNSWGSGFIGTLTVVNRGESVVPLWRLSARFPGVVIRSVWSPSGAVNGAHSGGRIDGIGRVPGPGQSAQLSFQAEGQPGAPAACSLNGRSC
ncbi:cellulose binding domain-containing protein [Actinomadura harenae]|uniref:CBM2 domain-containing protein n=1 Tax=Actinomadura harenae TaxID=2483351 RepID=A0A3M2LIW8_9ACTN|nr:hypothetical protein EBO15_39945 [Actinomadura harenae]